MSPENESKAKNVSLFDMPALKSEYAVGQSFDFIERDAYEKGYASGEKAGFEMGEQKATVLLDRLESAIGELTTLKETMIRDTESQMVELAVSIARKILMRELTTKPADIVAMTKEALMKIERTGQITIKINPILYDLFMKMKPQLLNIHPDIVFDIDPSASPFGSVVMGAVEDVVTDLDEQIKNLIKDIRDYHAAH